MSFFSKMLLKFIGRKGVANFYKDKSYGSATTLQVYNRNGYTCMNEYVQKLIRNKKFPDKTLYMVAYKKENNDSFRMPYDVQD